MSYRSYSRARGYRSSNYNETRTSSALLLPPDRDILEGLGSSPLQELQKPEESDYKDIKLKDFQYIGSYNWTNSNAPTIIVPGKSDNGRKEGCSQRRSRFSSGVAR